jgi:hypothetical protein
MKTTMFTGRQMSPIGNDQGHIAGFVVPTLAAYATEYSELTPPRDVSAGFIQLSEGNDYWIAGEKVFLFNPLTSPFLTLNNALRGSRLVIHYHGIRDHELLFPQISDHALRKRLGEFYEEAERAFDSSAWLSFSLMAAAVYEGLLGWRLQAPKGSLSDLIRLHEVTGSLMSTMRLF